MFDDTGGQDKSIDISHYYPTIILIKKTRKTIMNYP